MPEEILLIAEPAQSFNIVLDEQNCEIKLRNRLNNTYMSMVVDGEEVWNNYICYDRQNIKPFCYMNFKGILTFRDLEGLTDPIYTGFNSRYFLLYYSEDEELPDNIVDNCK